MCELYIRSSKKSVSEIWFLSGKSQGNVRESCFSKILESLINI